MSAPPHNPVTGELWGEDADQAAAKVVMKLIKTELKAWDAREARGIRHMPGARDALVRLYQEMERRSRELAAANNDRSRT